jgi:polysaccharide biosynthesis transport protein
MSDTGERITSTADRLKMARSQLDQARAVYAPDHPDVVTLEREVQGLEKDVAASGEAIDPARTADDLSDLRRRLEQAQAQLAQARERYGPDHPDRQQLERKVAELQKELAAAPPLVQPASPVAPAHADNPAYVDVKAQLAATVSDLKAIDLELAKLRERAQGYERDVNLSPAVEKEYRELLRDYDNARAKYQELRSKQVEAKTAQDLEADRKGERFNLIDPPLPPETPISPNRKLIFAFGMLLSAALTCGLLWLLETLDTSVRGRADLQQLLGVPALAVVPRITTEADLIEGQRRRWVATGAAAASVCVAALLVHLFYLPLDVLWFAVLHRIGISN